MLISLSMCRCPVLMRTQYHSGNGGHFCYDRLVCRFRVSPLGDMAGLMVTFTLSRAASSTLRMSSSNSSATLSTIYAHRIHRHVGGGGGEGEYGCIIFACFQAWKMDGSSQQGENAKGRAAKPLMLFNG